MFAQYQIIDEKTWKRFMPWVTCTHISHTNSVKKDNATPLFDWGKYFERVGKILLAVSVQAQHSFVDGRHTWRFADAY